MNVDGFVNALPERLPQGAMQRPTRRYGVRGLQRWFDPCPDVQGFTSVKVQRLLNTALDFLEPGEGYLEIGSHKGKTLITALHNHPNAPAFACDNFSQFAAADAEAVLEGNLQRHGIRNQVSLLLGDFHTAVNRESVPVPVGVYLYDAAHDFDAQRDGLLHVEPLLADRALVIVDDWQHGGDPAFAAKPGTEAAIEASDQCYRVLFDLPSRFNRDREHWWNGLGVLEFQRRRGD